jgi:hypothetical protein
LISVEQHKALTASCRCGAVVLEVIGAPIEQMPDAPPVLDADGGTDFVLYRKDRVRCVRGDERREARRLEPDAPTRRMVANCCHSAMFLDFTKGHWLTLYRARLSGPVPPLEMRVMTADRPAGLELPQDVPSYAGHTGKLMGKLLTAWVAMGFRSPKVDGVPAA